MKECPESFKFALVAGAIAGGGLTVIANAPNPAAFAILQERFGPDGISAFQLAYSALIPTVVSMVCPLVFTLIVIALHGNRRKTERRFRRRKGDRPNAQQPNEKDSLHWKSAKERIPSMIGSRQKTQSMRQIALIPFVYMSVMVACTGIMNTAPPQQAGPESKIPAAGTSSPALSQPSRHVIADAHLHYVDFLQQTDGIQNIMKAMDSAGVNHAMISGMALVKKWEEADPKRPPYYLSDDSRVYWYSATDMIVARAVTQLPAHQRRRFHPFITGVNAADKNAVNHIELMMESYPDLWQGIGELFGHHDDLTALTYGEVPRPNTQAMQRIFEFAGQHDLPVSLHTSITSVWEKKEPLWLEEFETALKRNRGTRFIWCHAGISRRLVVPDLTGILRTLLTQYPNLWIDLSWVVYDDYVAPLNTHGDKRIVNEDWLALLKDFPDRFMIGSDAIGHMDTYAATVRRYDVLLDAMEPATARKVAHDNFLSVLPKRAGIMRGEERSGSTQ